MVFPPRSDLARSCPRSSTSSCAVVLFTRYRFTKSISRTPPISRRGRNSRSLLLALFSIKKKNNTSAILNFFFTVCDWVCVIACFKQNIAKNRCSCDVRFLVKRKIASLLAMCEYRNSNRRCDIWWNANCDAIRNVRYFGSKVAMRSLMKRGPDTHAYQNPNMKAISEGTQ